MAQSAVQLIYNWISRSQYSTYPLLFQTLSNIKVNSDFTAMVWHSNFRHFKWIRIRDKKFKKVQLKNFFIIFFRSKFAIYLCLGLLKGRPSYSRSLSPRNNTSSTSKNEICLLACFCGSFLPSWSQIRLQIRMQSGFGSTMKITFRKIRKERSYNHWKIFS